MPGAASLPTLSDRHYDRNSGGAIDGRMPFRGWTGHGPAPTVRSGLLHIGISAERAAVVRHIAPGAPPDGTAGHYRIENGVSLIEISLNRVEQLFNSLDPAPFREKDLDADAEEYIVGAAQDLSPRFPFKIVLYLPADEAASPGAAAIADGVRRFFEYGLAAERRKLRAALHDGRVSLAIGLAFLFGCVALRQLLIAVEEPGTFGHIAAEGLLIAGWVAMWRPLDAFLYGWWPIRRRCRVLAKLTVVPVEVRARDA